MLDGFSLDTNREYLFSDFQCKGKFFYYINISLHPRTKFSKNHFTLILKMNNGKIFFSIDKLFLPPSKRLLVHLHATNPAVPSSFLVPHSEGIIYHRKAMELSKAATRDQSTALDRLTPIDSTWIFIHFKERSFGVPLQP